MRKLIASLTLAVASLTLIIPAHAGDDDTIVSKTARISIKVPSGWKSKTTKEEVVLTDKKEDTAVSFVLVPAAELKKAAKAVGKHLKDKVDDLEWKKQEPVEINGMKGIAFDGDGKIDGKDVDLAVVVLDTPNPDKDLIVLAIAEDAVLAKHKEEIKFVFHNLKPLK